VEDLALYSAYIAKNSGRAILIAWFTIGKLYEIISLTLSRMI
jgi:hypothetical protein